MFSLNVSYFSFGAVDSSKAMLGTFSPQAEPYQHVMPEETTPSGIFARGTYSARTKVYRFIYMTKKLGKIIKSLQTNCFPNQNLVISLTILDGFEAFLNANMI